MEPTTAAAPAPLIARFNTLIRPYLVLKIGVTMIATIVFIPLVPFWFLGIGQWWARHYFEKLTCELDDNAVRFSRGILVSVEKTIPLENIQDVTFIEGPLLRAFGLSILRFETAGLSVGNANQMQLVGIVDANAFRHEILARREAHKRRAPLAVTDPTRAEELELLRSIDRRLAELADALKPNATR